ncbi:MAG: hypothetical protein CFE43_12100 [Burkholderiales bacterium PBB3]|nr:MAG: hypothetical protein CFE43_12100 [Burkholderiales bacterium PBB3]
MLLYVWWFGWFVALVMNALVIYLFVVFGIAAAAGSGPVKSFLWFTFACIGVSLFASIYLMRKEQFVFGIVATASWFPLAAILGIAYGVLSET